MLGSGHQRRIIRTIGGSILGLSLLLTACGGSGDDDDDSGPKTDSGERDATEAAGQVQGGSSSGTLADGASWVATANDGVSEVAVYPDASSSDTSEVITNPNEYGAKAVFLVDGADVSGDRIPVFLPVAPNGSKGWVNKTDVTLSQSEYHVKIESAAHRLTVTKAGSETVLDTTVALGRDTRATPPGTYFITELMRTDNPEGDYGPYIYTISGFPTDPAVISEFGEDAVVGIHGTNKPELLGQDVSSGCIRMDSAEITSMTEYLPLGTPVEIVA